MRFFEEPPRSSDRLDSTRKMGGDTREGREGDGGGRNGSSNGRGTAARGHRGLGGGERTRGEEVRESGDSEFMEEMVSGIDEMRGVQDVIKTTFTVLHDTIKAQGLAIKALEQEMKSKVSTAHFQKELIHKANILDINSSLEDVSTALENKANTWDLDAKVERTEMHNLFQARVASENVAAEFGATYGKEDVEVLRLQLERNISSLKSDMDKIGNQFASNLADVREEVRGTLERKLDVAPFEVCIHMYIYHMDMCIYIYIHVHIYIHE